MDHDATIEVIRGLERLGIEYFLTGSEALARYGEPRQTADTDLVLALAPASFHRIRREFERDWVVNDPIPYPRQSLASLVSQSGYGKVDLILGRTDAWGRAAHARRERWSHPRFGEVWVSSLEDLVLAKLEWSQGISELQLRDCANLVRTNRDMIDQPYLERYARVVGVEELLNQVRSPIT